MISISSIFQMQEPILILLIYVCKFPQMVEALGKRVLLTMNTLHTDTIAVGQTEPKLPQGILRFSYLIWRRWERGLRKR